MNTIDEVGLSLGLYTTLKNMGVTYVKDIKKVDYSRLTKEECIELLEEFANYQD